MEKDDEGREGVRAEETELEQVDEAPEESEWEAFDEYYEDYKPTGKRVIADDGLPTVAETDASEDDIPPLSLETLICMEDRSKFVRRDFSGRILEEFSPEEVCRRPDGKWYLKDERERECVEPIRPRCRHYVQQTGQLSNNPKHRAHFRLCAARRTTEGTFMSVANQGFWACTMREPRDISSEEKHIESFDTLKIRQGKTRVRHSIFGSSE